LTLKFSVCAVSLSWKYGAFKLYFFKKKPHKYNYFLNNLNKQEMKGYKTLAFGLIAAVGTYMIYGYFTRNKEKFNFEKLKGGDCNACSTK
tara:strand:- start:2527 stop:2796 length:270 start_codon:yes stop_codon:yes gene_type:complete